MRILAITLLCLFTLGCTKSEPKPAPKPTVDITVGPVDVEIGPTSPKDDTKEELKRPKREYTPSYKRGYNDGYGGNWIAPIGWVIASEYRSGWNEGKKDLEAGNANKFD